MTAVPTSRRHIIRIISAPPVFQKTGHLKTSLNSVPQYGLILEFMEGLTTARLAHEGGVNVETIRYYERHGLLPKPPRTHSGYRVFSDEAVTRLRFIKHAQDLGFSLKEIKELLSLRVKPGSSCSDVRRKAEAKIVDMDGKIQRLQTIKRALVELTSACSGRGPASRCTILQALNDRVIS